MHCNQCIFLPAIGAVAQCGYRCVYFKAVDHRQVPVYAQLARGQRHHQQIIHLPNGTKEWWLMKRWQELRYLRGRTHLDCLVSTVSKQNMVTQHSNYRHYCTFARFKVSTHNSLMSSLITIPFSRLPCTEEDGEYKKSKHNNWCIHKTRLTVVAARYSATKLQRHTNSMNLCTSINICLPCESSSWPFDPS